MAIRADNSPEIKALVESLGLGEVYNCITSVDLHAHAGEPVNVEIGLFAKSGFHAALPAETLVTINVLVPEGYVLREWIDGSGRKCFAASRIEAE